jgi:hypothetical protein
MSREGPFSRFAHLVRTAESLRELIESYGLVKRRELDAAVVAVSSAWANAWMVVGEATEVASKLGRKVSAVHAARAAAAHIDGFARPIMTPRGYRVATASTRPLRDAITALRLALPEVAIPRSAPFAIRRAPRGRGTAVAVSAALAAIVFVIAWVCGRAGAW